MDTTPISLDSGTEIVPADFTAAYLASDTADKIFGFSVAKPLSARLVKVVGQIADQKATISCYHTSVSISGQDAAIIASLIVKGELFVEGLTTAEALDPWPIMEALLVEEGMFSVIHEEESLTFNNLSDLDQYRRDK
jgi:saccharopine dehydrogenase-like NADP-dependent oxidoreductase